jgi:hypothetical protein
MKRNPSRSGTRSLADELAELRRLDPSALKQCWRVLYRTEAPVHIGQSLLLQAVTRLGSLARPLPCKAPLILRPFTWF